MTDDAGKQGKDQREVLAGKDDVTRSSIGLQQWGDESLGASGGNGSGGTAERAAKISKGQKRSEDARAQRES